MRLRIALATALLLTSSAASAAPRRALLVGNHEGNADQASLRYTADDVRRLGSVLTELGGAETSQLEDATADQVTAKLDALAKGDRSELFVFYYSGHADGANLSLGGSTLPLATLLAKIALVPADLRVVVLDACQSGAATRAKGVTLAAPFDVTARTEDSTGDVVITSSSASEASYESDASRAGVFSLYFATALRGAGDEDGDGTVTIGEAYRYAYTQTLRSTLLTTGGPQHPTFRYAVEGQREPVLTRLASSAHLTLRASEAGNFVLFDERESRVFAEVRVEKDRQARLALVAGKYVVRKRGSRDLRTASIALAAKDDRVLDESQMPSVPLIRLPSKGGLGNLALGLSAGQYWSGLGEQGHLRLMLGPEWERSTWLFRGELALGIGTQQNNGLDTSERSGGLLVSALTGVRVGGVFIRGGPLAGAEVIIEQPTGRRQCAGMAFRVGPRLRTDIALSRNISLFSVLDVDLLVTPVEGRVTGVGTSAGNVGFFGSASYGFGFVNAW